MAVKKVNVTIEEELLQKIDDYAKSVGLKRSAFLSVAASQYITSLENLPSLKKFMDNLSDLAEKAMDVNADKDSLLLELENLEGEFDDLNK